MAGETQKPSRDDEGATNPETHAEAVKRLARESEADAILERDRAGISILDDVVRQALGEPDPNPGPFAVNEILEIRIDGELSRELKWIWAHHRNDERTPGWWVAGYCCALLAERLRAFREFVEGEERRARVADVPF